MFHAGYVKLTFWLPVHRTSSTNVKIYVVVPMSTPETLKSFVFPSLILVASSILAFTIQLVRMSFTR